MITLTPDDGERYQGIVALEKESLSECLEDYFEQSEQLPTRIILHANNDNKAQAAGLLIQTLPVNNVDIEEHKAQFTHVTTLASTVKDEELYNLDNEELLYRLYHEEKVHLFEATPITFKCHCSKERCLSSLASISPEEIEEILEEKGAIDMHCEYCGSDYHFERDELAILIDADQQTQH